MSNVETEPVEMRCAATADSRVEILTARDVPLGGPRAIRVRRTLPQRQRSLVGAWCFADHYGPHDVRTSSGMDVPPHPHTGLQTVSWLFAGEVEHRDSAGVHAMVRPGELNLMTAGAGICHSEVSTAATSVLHGVQLWVALPDAHRDTARGFDHFVPTPVRRDQSVLRVFLGELDGVRSPVPTFTPLLGAQLDIHPGAAVSVPVDVSYEHAVLVDRGDVMVADQKVLPGELAYQGPGVSQLLIHNVGEQPACVVVLGGTPFEEELVMWWNFVGRSHDDIATYREQWQQHDDRFGAVSGYQGATSRLPAPPLPTARLKPRALPPRREQS